LTRSTWGEAIVMLGACITFLVQEEIRTRCPRLFGAFERS
jgi:hypothetical protein